VADISLLAYVPTVIRLPNGTDQRRPVYVALLRWSTGQTLDLIRDCKGSLSVTVHLQ